MPRRSHSHYNHAHQQLRRFWLHHQGLFAELSPSEQWRLHDYFQPSKDWSRDQLLAHRATITKRRPGLPRQAGRTYTKFLQYAAAPASRVSTGIPVARSGGSRGVRNITVRAVVKPEIDYAKLARAPLDMAREEQRRAREEDDQAA